MFDKIFYKTPAIIREILPGVEWRIETTTRQIYLTFDDGPIPGLTHKILDILAENEAKATFFCVGDNIRKHPDVFKEILASGHAVGNHTQHHLKAWKSAKRDYLNDIDACESYINKYHQPSKKLFRPPYGQITPTLSNTITKLGYRIIMWDVLSRDYNQKISPENIMRKSIQYSGEGSIIVFHDNIKAQENVLFVLPQYIKYFSERGFKFLAL
ncbi:polysaccharide deacetylase family protein [Marivirga sp. S37H4]|uniref:Polysaccharide deacetylase family protein n=1 Tax=Marivirga aurantiaca TaxID=2802615 RepID=A0A935CA09_9BACT|nr:polysaccharide deacetylase family protein [Marivirga aurantiaca]MBK6266320.1 polysaccharide deacetylase family protein [Marivirga aurantiaca]